jgi:hypothetical protein
MKGTDISKLKKLNVVMMLALCHGAAFFLAYVSCSWLALESEMLQNQLGW